MRKTLCIISLVTGLISAICATILGYMYLTDAVKRIQKIKARITNRIGNKG